VTARYPELAAQRAKGCQNLLALGMLLALPGVVRPLFRRDALFARNDNRRMMLAVMLVIAVIAVAIPTCEMIGCDMGMCGGMMRITTIPGPTLGNACGGTWLSSSSVAGIMPAEFLTLILALIAAMAVSLMMFSPRVEFQVARLVEANAPPPPLDPRGERFVL